MKFAYMEVKMALVKLLTTFEILPSPHTPHFLEFSEGIVRTPKNNQINIMLKKRDC